MASPRLRRRDLTNASGGRRQIGSQKWLQRSLLTSWRVWRLPREDFASGEHGRGDAAAFIKFGENHRDEVRTQ